MSKKLKMIFVSLFLCSCGNASKSGNNGPGSPLPLNGSTISGTIEKTDWVGLAGRARLNSTSGETKLVVEAIPYRPADPCEPFPYPTEFYDISFRVPHAAGDYTLDCGVGTGDLFVSFGHHEQAGDGVSGRGVNGCGSVTIIEITESSVVGSLSLSGGWDGTQVKGRFEFPVCNSNNRP